MPKWSTLSFLPVWIIPHFESHNYNLFIMITNHRMKRDNKQRLLLLAYCNSQNKKLGNYANKIIFRNQKLKNYYVNHTTNRGKKRKMKVHTSQSSNASKHHARVSMPSQTLIWGKGTKSFPPLLSEISTQQSCFSPRQWQSVHMQSGCIQGLYLVPPPKM